MKSVALLLTASAVLATTAAAANVTEAALTTTEANATEAAANVGSPQAYITRCSYFHVINKVHTWPGADQVCNDATQNVCIADPTLPIGLCQRSHFLGSGTSSKIMTNATHFWTAVFHDPSRDEHCQEGTEIPAVGKFEQLPRGVFNECAAKYPGNGKLNPDWQEPSNFCSEHKGKMYKISDAKSCVGAAKSTSTGLMGCPKANVYGTKIPLICGTPYWSNPPPCGCFGGEMFFNPAQEQQEQ
jgi:hypothetical protein